MLSVIVLIVCATASSICSQPIREEFTKVSAVRWSTRNKFALKELEVWSSTMLYHDPCSSDIFRLFRNRDDRSKFQFESVCNPYFDVTVIQPLSQFCTLSSKSKIVRTKRGELNLSSSSSFNNRTKRASLPAFARKIISIATMAYPEFISKIVYRVADMALNCVARYWDEIVSGPLESIEEVEEESGRQQSLLIPKMKREELQDFKLDDEDGRWVNLRNRYRYQLTRMEIVQ